MSLQKFVNRPDLHLIKVTVSIFSIRPIYGRHYGSQKIEIEIAMFAAKIDRNRSKSIDTSKVTINPTLKNEAAQLFVHSAVYKQITSKIDDTDRNE